MEYRSQTWSVACTVRAPAHITNAFLKHYASLNPEKIYLFFDDPEFIDFDPTIAPGIVISFVCNSSYWHNVPKISPTKNPGVRPKGIEIRQHTNMLYAREIMASDWLLHVDSDELLYAKKEVCAVLSSYPEHVFSICLKNYEAVYTSDVKEGEEFSSNYFKRYFPEKKILAKYYTEELIKLSRGGFWGVETGKSFVRKSPVIFKMSVHRPVPYNPNLVANVKTNDLELLHFEGQSFELFKVKHYLRSKKKVATLMPDRFSKRIEKIDEVIHAGGEEGLKSLYNQFYVMNGEKLLNAIADGFIEEKNWSTSTPSAHDLITNNNPLEEERGQSLSLWQGVLVRTFHNSYLAYDVDARTIISATAYQLSHNKNIYPLEVQTIQGNKSVLFYKTFIEIFYLNDIGALTEKHFTFLKQDACLFEIVNHQDSDYAISLRTNSGFIRVSPNGDVTFDSTDALDWEKLYLKTVLPQL